MAYIGDLKIYKPDENLPILQWKLGHPGNSLFYHRNVGTKVAADQDHNTKIQFIAVNNFF